MDNQIVKQLSVTLANSYVLMVKLHNYHWNVTGPHFVTLHELFQEQYTELFTAIDELAERIRALGEIAPGSMADFLKLATVKECHTQHEALKMVSELARDNDVLTKQCQEVLEVCQSVGDEATADMMIGRIQVHDKNLWMLNAILK